MQDLLKSHFDMFARYNTWANARLYDAAGALPDADYRADRGAFFKSVHGTLNHLLVTDRVWMHRCTGEGTPPERLDTIVFDTFAELDAERREEDSRIERYVTALTPQALAGTISYKRVTTPELFTQPLMPALAHWFNHQTHHRGQAHALLTSLTGRAPELDLLFFQRLALTGGA
ncbi:dinb protein [Candidatus Burkholderia verschuerenii]|uniref:Dinb protein n=1 Tax=Candidatus Burkholderia verschuerenii TaxID=242163 RepID=A0A0L0MI67_9BURK|nr:DinB family protein [Candidatus Burkholderia verschuerenii]KND62008.1 dinb protein [Candidatus Burkholderia verschuerenii]